MTTSASSAARITLADSMLKEGIISREQYERAIDEYNRSKRSLVGILTDMGALSDQKRLEFLARKTQCEIVKLKDVVPSLDVAGFMTRELCRRQHLVPLRIDANRVVIAMQDPTDLRLISDLERLFGRNIKPVLASSAEILDTVERLPLENRTAATAPTIEIGLGYKLVSTFTLLLLTLAPMAGSWWYVFKYDKGQEWYSSFSFSTFETALLLMVVWGSWAAISYFINDLIFGQSAEA
ncbi:hypothetical protein GC173_06830 [bacterium]|nr:hypothetical protein [bacterium]